MLSWPSLCGFGARRSVFTCNLRIRIFDFNERWTQRPASEFGAGFLYLHAARLPDFPAFIPSAALDL